MEEEEPKEAVRWRAQVGGDGDEVIRGSNPPTGGSRRTSSKTHRWNFNTENVEGDEVPHR